jgi:hypothetical protein
MWVPALAAILAISTWAQTAPAATTAAVSGEALAAQLGESLQHLQTAMAAVDTQQLHLHDEGKQVIAESQASVARNLQQAMPALLSAFSQTPQDLGAAFRLYRDGEAVLGVAQRSSEAIPARDADSGGAALAASTDEVRTGLNRLADWIETHGRSQYAALQRAQAAAAAQPAAAPPPPATLVIQDANGAAKKKAAQPSPKPAGKKPAPPTIPHLR